MSSTSGMITMEVKLTPEDICRIIQECGKFGVLEFSLGDLSLKFLGTIQTGVLETVVNTLETKEPTQPEINNSKKLDDERRIELKRFIDEKAIENSILEDPVMYDRMAQAGLIEGKDAGLDPEDIRD